MKKIGLILIAVLVLGGVGFLAVGRNRQSSTTTSGEQAKGVFESIKDAMAKSLSLKCEYNVGTNKSTAYLKGKAVRIDGSYAEKTNTGIIMKDDKLWTWDMVKKEGIIMPLNTNQDQSENTSLTEVIESLEKEKQFCKPAVVADSIFDPPSDVQFQDLAKMFENLPKAGQ